MVTDRAVERAPQLRQPRLAEMVADVLRRRIISGALSDGAMLAKQEDLLAEFRVSKPSLREALRILETEGLITVRRGNLGGAIVHVPRPESAAYTLSLILQSRAVKLADVGNALRHMEPVCAALCAERADRATEVIPALQQVNAAAAAAVKDPVELTRMTRRFHELLVELCGNETMIIVVGALESMWSAHEQDWVRSDTSRSAFTDDETSRTSRHAHGRILRLIESGDVDGVAKLVRRHLEDSVFYARSVAAAETVRADAVKAPSLSPGA